MKYLGVKTIKDLYPSLKLTYAMMRREGIFTSATKGSDQSLDTMREEFLEYLLLKGRVTILKSVVDHDLSMDDICLS